MILFRILTLELRFECQVTLFGSLIKNDFIFIDIQTKISGKELC